MSRDLQIVLKISERCNINCTYCYYFNHGNTSAHERPAYISRDVVSGVYNFVRRSTELIDVGRINVILHGGEPLMVKKRHFAALCTEFSRLQDLRIPFHLALTTNGMLIDDEWISIMSDYNIGVAVSIDGPQEYHDRERLDFQGRGTYSRVIDGIEMLRAAADGGRIDEPSALATIDVRSKGDVVYNHLARILKFTSMDFLVPQLLHDSNPGRDTTHAVGRYLLEAFNEWVRDDNPDIHVRVFNRYMDQILGRGNAKDRNPDFIIVAVTSSGKIVNDDYMLEIQPPLFTADLNVQRNDINDYLKALKQGVLGEVYRPHDECVKCEWFNVCRPSVLPYAGAEMRYKRETGFRNKLVYCEAYQGLFNAMQEYVRLSTVAPARVRHAA